MRKRSCSAPPKRKFNNNKPQHPGAAQQQVLPPPPSSPAAVADIEILPPPPATVLKTGGGLHLRARIPPPKVDARMMVSSDVHIPVPVSAPYESNLSGQRRTCTPHGRRSNTPHRGPSAVQSTASGIVPAATSKRYSSAPPKRLGVAQKQPVPPPQANSQSGPQNSGTHHNSPASVPVSARVQVSTDSAPYDGPRYPMPSGTARCNPYREVFQQRPMAEPTSQGLASTIVRDRMDPPRLLPSHVQNFYYGALASAGPLIQKNYLGWCLRGLVRELEPKLDLLITGKLLELSNEELLNMISDPTSLIMEINKVSNWLHRQQPAASLCSGAHCEPSIVMAGIFPSDHLPSHVHDQYNAGLVSGNPLIQKNHFGMCLWWLVGEREPELELVITGKLLEFSNDKLRHLIKNHSALNTNISVILVSRIVQPVL